MKKVNRYLQVASLFLFTGILAVITILIISNSALDIELHDTYLVVGRGPLALIAASLPIFFALIYYLFQRVGRPLKQSLGLIHYIITTLTVVIIFIVPYAQMGNIPKRYYAMDSFQEPAIGLFGN